MFKLTALGVIFAGTVCWAGGHVKAQAGEEVTDELIVRLKPGREVSESIHRRLGTRYRDRWSNLRLDHLRKVRFHPGEADAVGAMIAADPAVDLVEPDRVVHIAALPAPNDPSYSSQPNLSLVRALEGWRWFPGRHLTSSLSLERVRVAVLDTGADCTHPDFANSGGTSTNSASGGQISWSSSSAIRNTTTPSPACTWQDDNGHGTYVSGVVAAATNNGVGIASVGPAVELLVIKISDSTGSTTTSTVADGIAAATAAGARVINLSLITNTYSQAMQDAINAAWARNVIVVAAAGNAGIQSVAFPAAANHAVGVGAVDSTGAIASFSTRGISIDIVAPGVDILTLAPIYSNVRGNRDYATISGTSMAAPHVAALAGLLMMASPGAAADAVTQRIQRSAVLSADGWSSDFGYGYINVERAVTGAGFRGATRGGVTGQVVDSAGLPINGATVTLNSESVTTPVSGIFRFGSVAAGDYTMVVSATGQTTLNIPVTVAAGSDTPTHFQMGRSYGTFTGTLTAGGSPVPGAIVQALSGGLVAGVAVTNATGNYRLFVPAGTYEIRSGAFFQEPASAASRTVGASSTVNVDLVAQPFGRLEGSIRDSANAAVVDAQILMALSNRSAGAVSDSAGNYLTIPVPAGTYSATATLNAASSDAANVSIVNATTSRLDMVLRSSSDPIVMTPSSASPGALGGSGSFSIVTNPASLAWTATTTSAWIQIAPGSGSGTGNATVNYTVAPNPGNASRTGTIQVNSTAFRITQGAPSGSVTGSPTSLNVPAAGANGSITVSGTGEWVASTQTSWITISGSGTGTGNGSFSYSIAANSGAARSGSISLNSQSIAVSQAAASGGGGTITLNPTSLSFGSTGGSNSVQVTASSSSLNWTATPSDNWISITSGATGVGNGTVNFNVAANAGSSSRSGSIQIGGATLSITQSGTSTGGGPAGGQHFVSIAPCRIADTREDLGEFGRPALAGNGTRDFAIPRSRCGIPSSAKAYSLNVTVVPRETLGFLTVWPAGTPWPGVSTLNSPDGRVKANAAIVVAGTDGAVSVFSTGNTELILDINGYFVDSGTSTNGLVYYSLTPCRLVDTRNPGGTMIRGGESRSLPMRSANCGIPSTARAYSVNATVVPPGPLGYITLWPTGQAQPFVSTLNSPKGSVVANAAIVPAGDNGDISVFAQGDTHLVMDISGYFAPPGASGAQRFFPITPCRISDSRNATGPFGGPILANGEARSIPVRTAPACGFPATATGYSLNATVVPPANLGYLTMWPTGLAQPFVSTLNAFGDAIVANAALVGAGTGGAVSVFAAEPTHLVLDANGYFAP